MDRPTQEVKCRSGRVITIQELNGLEQTNADLAADGPYVIFPYRVAASLVKIDEKPLSPATNKLLLDQRLQSISGPELDDTVRAYNTMFGATADRLGKSSEAGAESPS